MPEVCGDGIAAPGHHCYGRPTQFDNNEFVVCMGAGDTNSDGNADIVFAQEGVAVLVALGDGSGGFGPVLLNDALAPSTCLVRDFDSDGSTELAMRFPTDVGLWRVTGTGGTLLGASDSTLSGSAILWVAPDFNGDGVLDLVAGVNSQSDDRVRPHIVAPALDGLEATPGPGVGDDLLAIADGDLNDDGFSDVVWISSSEGTPLRIGAMLGNGSGKLPVTLTLIYEAADGVELRDLALADVSGDEALDIVVIEDGELSILPGDGLLGFGPLEQLPTIGTPHRVVTAELDGTDTPEIAILYEDIAQLGIVDVDEGGPFIVNLPLPLVGVELDVADANGDGVDDFLVASVGYGPVILVPSDL